MSIILVYVGLKDVLALQKVRESSQKVELTGLTNGATVGGRNKAQVKGAETR